jgi:hypothetical protein
MWMFDPIKFLFIQATHPNFKRLIISVGLNNNEAFAEDLFKLVYRAFRFILATLENEGE